MKSFSIPISRRNFVKMAGMAAAGALVGPGGGEIRVAEAADGLGGDTVKSAGRKIPVLYDMDVCVIGGGPRERRRRSMRPGTAR
ncbi:MAG: twin-arginine translocation signal domain-containing protein [Schwartzia sp.]|nr:twin-arginine translocation signal domain-containing protein [Schwartzia sp. (in: firmicutes)]